MSKATRKRYEIPIEEPKAGTKYIPLTQGKIAVIDEQDYERVSQHKWHAVRKSGGKYWYAATAMEIDGRRKNIYLHRFILDPPPDKVVDHIDHDGLNCTRGNMRVCTRRRNQRNRKWGWEPTEDAFIEALQELIEEHSITGIAETAGLSRPTIYHLLQGKREPQRKTLDKLAAAYPELAPSGQRTTR